MESALQIIGFLKRCYGTPVPILRIAQNIRLSYQPTHKHVRALEQQGVVETLKAGREVLCQLRGSEATHLWLALHGLGERDRLLAESGTLSELIRTLQQTLSQPDLPGLEAVAITEPEPASVPEVIMLASLAAGELFLPRFRARCRAVNPQVQVTVLEARELREGGLSEEQRQRWVAEGIALHGAQRFWEAVLPEEAARR